MAFTQNAPAKMRTLFSSGRGGTPLGVRLSRALRVRERPEEPSSLGNVAPTVAPTASAAPSAPAPRPITGLARTGTPNAGGTITRGGVTTSYAPSPAGGPSGTTNAGGSITKGGVTRSFGPSPYKAPVPRNNAGLPVSPPAIPPALPQVMPPALPAPLSSALPVPGSPVPSATTSNAQQTESANPLSGDGNAEPEDTSDAIKPGSALGVNQRGNSVPRGQDLMAGGTGPYRRKLSSPGAASVYDGVVRKLFSGSGASDDDEDD